MSAENWKIFSEILSILEPEQILRITLEDVRSKEDALNERVRAMKPDG